MLIPPPTPQKEEQSTNKQTINTMDICACNVIKCVSIQGLFVTIDDLQAFTVVYDEQMEQDSESAMCITPILMEALHRGIKVIMNNYRMAVDVIIESKVTQC